MKIKKFIKNTAIKTIVIVAAGIGVGESLKILTAMQLFVGQLSTAAVGLASNEQQESALNTYNPESGHTGGIQIGEDGSPILSVESNENDVVSNPKVESIQPEEGKETCSEAGTVDKDEVSLPQCYISLTEDEQYQLATLIWLEGRGEPIECQKAIASVVINRYTTQKYTQNNYSSILDVIYEKSQFSPAHLIAANQPTQTQLDVVKDIMTNGPSIPEYVTFFRAYYYHNWGSQMKYMLMGQTYFSYDLRLFEKWAADHPGHENTIHVPTH